jgi:hypothetical protein
LNGDGFPDLVMSADMYGEYVMLSNGDGTFRPMGAILPPTPPNGVGFAVVGDFNGDGIPDIAGTWAYSDTIHVFLGKGDGTFTPVAGPTYPTFWSPGGMAGADFNHDGKLDLVVTNLNANPTDITVLTGEGDGTFDSSPGNTAFPQTGSIITGNFDNDGRPDLAIATSGALTVLLTQPTQAATATANGVSPNGPGPHLVDASYPGDLNFNGSVSGTTSLDGQVATPVITPASGTYTSTQQVTVTDSTPGATVNYSTDGFNWQVYKGPITLNTDGYYFFSAYAIETGYLPSNSSSTNYLLQLPPAPPPSFSLAGGTYHSSQTLSLTDAAAGAAIYYTYTPSGATPTTSSVVYTGPITVNSTGIVEAVAIAPGYSVSRVSSKAYVYAPEPAAPAPAFSLAGGTYHTPQVLALVDSAPGATIYYTTNGTTPTTTSKVYTGPITIAATELVKAAAIAPGFTLSAPSAKSYVYDPYPPAAAPSFNLAGGTYSTPQALVLTDATPGATIYYTTNGTAPTTGSMRYTGPITIAATELVEATAIAAAYNLSPISSKSYTYSPLPLAAAPYFSLPGGHYATPQTLTLTDATPGAVIYYTTNGTTPSTASAKYTGPITVSTSETIEAIAVASGYNNSNVSAKSYTIP